MNRKDYNTVMEVVIKSHDLPRFRNSNTISSLEENNFFYPSNKNKNKLIYIYIYIYIYRIKKQ